MTREVYLRPAGFVSGTSKDARPIAGRPDLGFALIERIKRLGGREIMHASSFAAFCEPGLQELIRPRPPIAGLSMNRARVMGIVNVTPDSFSDGGNYATAQTAIDHGLRLADEGADILDIGGESTRPGAGPVPLDEELRRVMPVLEGLRAKTDTRISIDTRKAEVMRRAASAGAGILNDVSALTYDPEAIHVAAESGLPVILMHAQGDPRTMNDNPQYEDVLLDVFDFLEGRISACEAAGIPREKLIADPGIGFGKHLPHNVAVLAGLSLYHSLGVPVLLGASRKKLIGQLTNAENPKDRVPGSLAAALWAVAQGVQIVRVHDVSETRQAIDVWDAAARGTEIISAT